MSSFEERKKRATGLFLGAIERLDPAARTYEVLAALRWQPESAVVLAVGKAARGMARGALHYLATRPGRESAEGEEGDGKSGDAKLPGARSEVWDRMRGLVIAPARDEAGDGDSETGEPGREDADRAGEERAGEAGDSETTESGETGDSETTESGEAGDSETADRDAGEPGRDDERERAEDGETGETTGTGSEDCFARAGWTVLEASHPVPDERSMLAGQAAFGLLAGADGSEVLALISGGASALMELPASGLTLSDLVITVGVLQSSGVDIHGVNAVRKHLSDIKGGQLVTGCQAPILTLVASDVLGDDLAAVGSGPTLPDPTTFHRACAIVARVGWTDVPPSVRDHLERGAAGRVPETPKVARPDDRSLLMSGTEQAISAALESARAAGFEARVFARELGGDVLDWARRIAAQAHRAAAAGSHAPMCFVAGGESTITLPVDPGAGGRAQHVALLVARDLAGVENITVLVAGTDGIDGSSEAAGAVIDGETWSAIARAGIDPQKALDRCDSHRALRAVGADLVIGPTGVNHADLALIMVE